MNALFLVLSSWAQIPQDDPKYPKKDSQKEICFGLKQLEKPEGKNEKVFEWLIAH